MSGPVHLRWLPALVWFVVIPAAPQATVTFHALPPAPKPAASIPTATVNPPASSPGAALQTPLSAEDLGDLYEVRKRYQAAAAEYAQVEHPSAAVWNKMGIAYQMFFDLKDAMRCYKEAERLEPDNAHVLNNIATVHEALREFGPAERYYRKSLERDPHSATVHKNLGTNLLMQHKYKEGAQMYLEALKIDAHIFEPHDGPQMNDPAPHNERGTANYFTAQSCAEAGLNDCALEHLRQAIDEGSATRKRIAADPAFTSLRNTPFLQKLLTEQD